MTRERIAKAIGLALGIVAVVVAVSAWEVRSTGAALGADVQVVAVPPGELILEPSGAFLSAHGLHPGRAAEGRLRVRNITVRPARVRVRALPSGRDLDDVLHAEVMAGGRRIARGTLGQLRAWSRRSPALAVGEVGALTMRTWLARDAADRYRGAIASITLELRADVEGPS